MKSRTHLNVRYRAWLLSFSFRSCFKPVLNNFIALLQKQVFLAVILVFTAVGFRYYVLGLESDLDAVAATAESAALPAVSALSTISGEINRSANQNSDDNHLGSGRSGSMSQNQFREQSQDFLQDSSPVKSMVGTLAENTANESALEHAGKHADPTYVCPMHANILNKDPNASCPICGMDLVLIENTGGEAGVVSISPRIINMLGVRVSKVKKKTLYRRIKSVGNIQYDENRISHIHLRTDGWIEKLSVKALGDRVSKGDLLFKLYSPKLVNAQDELLQSLEMENDSLVEASRERLKSLGMSRSQIRSLEKSGRVSRLVNYFAPQNGVISELNVREGMYVKPSKTIVSLVNMSTIWLVANIFENQSSWVKVGDRADAKLSFMPDKSWKGTVEHIYPSLDARTRSLEVRVRFDNPDEILKANMYADVTIFAKPKRKVLSVPRESLIRTGEGDRVILSMGNGQFKPVVVQAGIESNNRVEILNGLNEGDDVVVSSQFLIDSESSLRASLMRMSGS